MRRTILSLVVAAGLSLLVQATASAQVAPGGGGYAPPGYTTGGAWRGYAPVSPWQGYYPGTSWTGYGPPPVAPTAPPAVVTTPPTYVAPSGVRYYYYVPQPTAPQPTVARRAVDLRDYRGMPTSPAFYSEYGSGRNVFLHKPWLPNQ